MSNLTLGSLFDGSGGFPLAGLLSGITPVWASEIEPFPIRVTTKRLPFMKHYGDISAMDGGEIEPVDIITFGSPCQDMSVAGKRDGLGGSRSSLFYEAIRIVKEMRCKTNGQYPRYIVWENVPGAFSSNKGEDFKCVLESVCQVKGETTTIPKPDKWQPAGCIVGRDFSIAWRVLDAQFWGVPQRRKRIFLVADFAGERAGKILFESEGLSRYSAESFRAWQEAAGRTEDCFGASGSNLVLNDQGGNRMDVTDDVTSTLRAEAHHPPCVMESAGFCTEHSAQSRSIGYEDEKSPTLRAGVVPAAVAVENHPTDSRIKLSDDGNVQTLTSRMGTGGNNVPLVMKIRAGCEGGGKGALIQTDKSATLSCNNDQTLFEPKVYGICSKDSNSMKSSNPDSGIYEAETSRTIDGNGGNPSCNQGGMAVVSVQGSMIGRKDKNGPRGSGVNEDISFTLDSVDRHAVAFRRETTSKNQKRYMMTTGSYTQITKNVSPTLAARDYKDPPIVNDSPKPQGFYPQMKAECVTLTEDKATTLVNGTNPGYQNGVVDTEYIVRRLTPTECARLQGFPDWWCSNLETENPSPEDIRHWYDIFETHRKVVGTSSKAKTIKQIQKWLKSPHSDSAEYKMWGNGVALPCVVFVLSGIACFHNRDF